MMGLLYLSLGHAFAENPDLKDLIFEPSGLTGAELRDAGRERVILWLENRAK